MSAVKKIEPNIVLESPHEFFVDRVSSALEKLKFEPHPLSREYLIDLLKRYMFVGTLFERDDETGRHRQDTLAEMYLRAQNSPIAVRVDLLKKLGDTSLYVSGFFGDSLSRKIIDIDYYVEMGGVAFAQLSSSVNDESFGLVYDEYAHKFSEFVDVLTYISQGARIQSNEDLLKLYGRYMATGSRLAEEQLVEKGLLNAETAKGKPHKV